MYNTTIVFAEPEELKSYEFDDSFILLDQNSIKTRSMAFKNKGAIAARLTPCCVVRDENNHIIKAFYKEASKDPIKDCLNWLHEKKESN